MKYTITTALLMLLVSGLMAQEELPPMVTDRPDQTESAETVPAGHVQIETGFVYEYDENTFNRTESYTYNTSLIRLGLTDALEARLGSDYSAVEVHPRYIPYSSTHKGFGPLYAGFKTRLFSEKGYKPSVAFMGGLSLPFTASEDFKPGNPAPGMRLAFAHALGNMFSLGYNFGAEWDGDTPDASYPYSVVLGIGATGKLGIFIESYGYLSDVALPDHRADGGLTYLIAPWLQADVSAGIGLTDISPDYFISFGLSTRF